MMHAASSIFKEKGIGGLYAGITPTLVEILPYAGLQFGLYDALKRRAAVGKGNPKSDTGSGFRDLYCALFGAIPRRLMLHLSRVFYYAMYACLGDSSS